MPDKLVSEMLRQFGPLLSGENLRKVLGFKTAAAFGQAARDGRLGVRVFEIEGRRGRFALTQDVAKWVESLPNYGASPDNNLCDEER